MKKYELLAIYKPNLDTEDIDKTLEKFDTEVAEMGGKIESRDKMGRRKLAYDIQKTRDGFFVNTVLSLPAEKGADLKRSLKLNDTVLRTRMLEVSEKASV